MPGPISTVRERRGAFFRAFSMLDLAVRQGMTLAERSESLRSKMGAGPEEMLAVVFEWKVRVDADAYVFVLALHRTGKGLRIVATHDPLLATDVDDFIAALQR